MKTNLGLVEYCKKQLGLPYWWGTFGQVATKTLYEQKKRQYPNQYLANDFKYQFGKRVHDCVGLIKGYMWTDDRGHITYNANQDKDVSGMLANCTEVGNVKDIPEIPGLLVFMKGHVGVYIGNGKVIEAKGHKYGVVETELSKRPWEVYGMLKWLDYEEETKMNEQYGSEVYDTIDKVPEWGRASVQKAIDAGILKGNGRSLLLTLTEVKVLCWLDRCKCLDFTE